MSQRRPAGIGRPARWLLLLATVFGVATMHTLGHAGMHAAGHHSAVSAVAGVVTPMAVPGCSDGDCHGTMSGWSVCLAVLGGLALGLLLAVLSRARRGRPRGRVRTAPVAEAPRPPPILLAGLTVASAAVLRI